MNGLMQLFLCTILAVGALGQPMGNEEPTDLTNQFSDYGGGAYSGGYGYPVMDKRRTLGRSPRLADYLKLAAMQYEMDKEEAEAGEVAQNEELLPPVGYNPEEAADTHSVEKRRRRYGFWATALNKMGNSGKRSEMKRGSYKYKYSNPQQQHLARFFANTRARLA
jgi:hypothetical protein